MARSDLWRPSIGRLNGLSKPGPNSTAFGRSVVAAHCSELRLFFFLFFISGCTSANERGISRMCKDSFFVSDKSLTQSDMVVKCKDPTDFLYSTLNILAFMNMFSACMIVQDTLPFALVPRFVYRFEDLNEFERRVSIVHQYIKRSSSVTGLTLTPQQVRVAVSNPQVMPMMKTNADTALLLRGHERYSAANITYAVRHCFKHLERFGYLQLYKGWLRLHDMQILQSQLQKYVDVFSNTYYPPNP
eukprot:TRINITY_DN8955_c0_g1_i3.p2 TRINITY_DN8955_c0_g1~~TRINITY_DN8955_c0_g1_i3.p2  ORF type:complete len:245 (+),score=32.98 TRINITY_DN8955_c0_g1_i3:778-1512(+)